MFKKRHCTSDAPLSESKAVEPLKLAEKVKKLQMT
jgi:hypothetical protein